MYPINMLCHWGWGERSTAPPVADEAVRSSNEAQSGDSVCVPATMPNCGWLRRMLSLTAPRPLCSFLREERRAKQVPPPCQGLFSPVETVSVCPKADARSMFSLTPTARFPPSPPRYAPWAHDIRTWGRSGRIPGEPQAPRDDSAGGSSGRRSRHSGRRSTRARPP